MTQTIVNMTEVDVDQLNRSAFDLRYSDWQQSRALAEMACDRAHLLNYARGQVEALNTLAWSHIEVGEADQAVELLHRALGLAADHDLDYQQVDALNLLGIVYDIVGNSADALNTFNRALNTALDRQFDDKTLSILNNMGVLHERLHDHDAAADCYHRVARLLTAKPDTPKATEFWASYHTNIAHIYVPLGRHDLAREYCLKSIPFLDACGDVRGKVSAFGTLFQIHFDANEIVSALAYAEQALAIVRAHGLHEDLPTVLCSTAKAYERLGQVDAMRAALAEALSMAEHVQDVTRLIDLYEDAADLYAQQGDTAQAADLYKKVAQKQKAWFESEANRRYAIAKALYMVDNARHEADIHRVRGEALAREMQERERAEAERLERRQVEFKLEQEREFGLLKNRILQRVTHEFRTPLTVIQVSNDLMLRYADRMLPEQREKSLRKINAQVMHLASMVDEIALLFRYQDGKLRVESERVPLGAQCQHILDQLGKTGVDLKRVQFQNTVADQTVLMDPDLFRHIVANLVTNALKFSEHTPVACDLRREQDDLVLVVRDQGIGIPVREQAAVFDVFYRASNIGEVPGTGIGLSIVRDCVAALGGSISLQSAEGQGTTVTVCLPAFA